ncbi:MAG: cytochrome o ubiquinol oxidase subunit IV [Pseudomonadota bacterium]|nr:cytochrome o ubiquinol oxidase subunit IV [Pseudomonadota bacterium]
MSPSEPTSELHLTDTAPGDQRLAGAEIAEAIKSYLIGLGLATLLTIVSFFISGTTLVWGPSIPVALVVLAFAQMGVHLVFFLHITTGPDNVNNVMALAFGVLIVLLLLTGSLWIMANLNHNMASTDQIMEMQLERGSVVRTVTASGVVGPTATAPVGARASGVIQALYCDANMQVKAAQLCAKIDPRPYQNVVDQNRADLAAAEARLEKDKADLAQAKAAFESHEALAKRPAISRKAIDKSRKAFERAQTQTKRDEARVVQLQAALHAAETNLGYTDIVSPIDGTVVSRNVEMGQTVAADSETPPLFVIAADLTLTHVEAIISAKDSGEVKLGDKATFTVGAFPNRPFSGAVTQIRPSPQTYEHVATYDVIISAPNPDLLLEPGMAATIRIVIE